MRIPSTLPIRELSKVLLALTFARDGPCTMRIWTTNPSDKFLVGLWIQDPVWHEQIFTISS